jgi:hypothetical protein
VRARARRAAETSIDYLRQEGLTDGTRSALADAGWSGVTAHAFDLLLAEAGGSSVAHLMLGLLKHSAQVRTDDGPDLSCWLFDAALQPRVLAGIPSINTCIEMFCAGTHGRTLGYRSVQDGRVEPVLTRPHNDEVLSWGIREVQRTVVDVARSVATQLTAEDAHQDLTPMAWPLLAAFWSSPTPQEVAAWGSFPWEEEIWPPFSPVAQSITTLDVLRRARRGDTALRRASSWRAGSAAVSSRPWRTLLRARSWQERYGERLTRVPRRLELEWALRRSGPR